MNFFRQRREKRRQKPRPSGRLANCWHSFKNAIFYCILCDDAVHDEDHQDKDQHSALSLSTQSLVSVSELSRISSTPEIKRKNKKLIHSHSSDKLRHLNWRTSKSSMSPSASSVSGWSLESIKSGLSLSASSSASGWSAGSYKSQSSLPSSSSSISGWSVNSQEDNTTTGMKPYSIDAWVSWSWSKESCKSENVQKSPPSQWRLSAADFTSSSSVQQALSFQNDLRVQYLGQDNSSNDVDLSCGTSSSEEDDVSLMSCASLQDSRANDDDIEETVKVSPPSSFSTKSPRTRLNMRELVGYHAGSTTVDKMESNPSTNIFGEGPAGTIADVYKLIKRTLDLGMSKNTKTSNSNKTVKEPKERRGVMDSLHRLHTEWDEHIVNVEVLLGLKKPRNSHEALAMRRELGDDAPSWCTDRDGGSDGSKYALKVASNASEQGYSKHSKVAIDSGFASASAF